MQDILNYDIPVWHPVAVHFPPALLVASAGVAAIWLARGTPHWRRFLLLLLGMSAVGTIFAYRTGEAIEAQSEGVPMVEIFIDLHHTMAVYTLWATLAALAVVGGLTVWLERKARPDVGVPLPREPLAARLGGALITLLAALLVVWTAHIGGIMVWGVPA